MRDLPKGLWVTETQQGSSADYYLWDVIDYSDTIVGHIFINGKQDWELESKGKKYKGTNLDQIIESYLGRR